MTVTEVTEYRVVVFPRSGRRGRPRKHYVRFSPEDGQTYTVTDNLDFAWLFDERMEAEAAQATMERRFPDAVSVIEDVVTQPKEQ